MFFYVFTFSGRYVLGGHAILFCELFVIVHLPVWDPEIPFDGPRVFGFHTAFYTGARSVFSFLSLVRAGTKVGVWNVFAQTIQVRCHGWEVKIWHDWGWWCSLIFHGFAFLPLLRI